MLLTAGSTTELAPLLLLLPPRRNVDLQEEEELEEFQLIEKLQQLGINQGESAGPARCWGLSRSCYQSQHPDFDDSNQPHPSLAAGDIKKAKEAGYHTCESLLMNTRKVTPVALVHALVPGVPLLATGHVSHTSKAWLRIYRAEAVRHQGAVRGKG